VRNRTNKKRKNCNEPSSKVCLLVRHDVEDLGRFLVVDPRSIGLSFVGKTGVGLGRWNRVPRGIPGC
jgi:hypothetical protein